MSDLDEQLRTRLGDLARSMQLTTDAVLRRNERDEATQEALRRAEDERRELLDRLDAVRSLHAEASQLSCGNGDYTVAVRCCGYCRERYPCRTVRLVNGQPADPVEPMAVGDGG